MLGSISPVGEASRNQRWWLTATAYAAASVTAGAFLGLLLGSLGTPAFTAVPSRVRLMALCVMAVLGAAADAGVFGGRIPSWHRQVDERWLTTYRGWVYGAGFGAQLGAAVTTIVTSASTYALLGAALLAGSWRGGLAIGVVFGAARALPLLLMAPVRTADRLYAVTRRVADAEPLARRLTVACQGALAGVALLAAVTR